MTLRRIRSRSQLWAMTALVPNDHFDGKRFFNPNGTCAKGFRDVLRWMVTRKPAKWPAFVANTLQSRPIKNCSPGETALTFIGHASFILQIGETNILLDPVLSERVSPVSWFGPKRVRPPGIQLQHLPPTHLVLVSHCHYDHLDLATLKALRLRYAPHVITPLANRELIATSGLSEITELDWWESTDFRGMRITVTPAQHFTARKFSDRNKRLWGGFVIEAEGKTIYFAGDTGYADHFKEIARRFPRIDLALLPIGAYEPRWFMTEYHMNPSEAVQAYVDLKPSRAVGMHFGTFQLTDEAIDEPVQALSRELKERGISSACFRTLDFGETVKI